MNDSHLSAYLSLLQGEEEFRDKLSPISISLNFSLDPHALVDQHSLRPILNYGTEQRVVQKVCVLTHNALGFRTCFGVFGLNAEGLAGLTLCSHSTHSKYLGANG